MKIWSLIDLLVNSGFKTDYLQVFELDFKGQLLTIKHFQEEPQYESIKEENVSFVCFFLSVLKVLIFIFLFIKMVSHHNIIEQGKKYC